MKESQHTEWKESWRDEYLRWFCGFANAEGGVLLYAGDNAFALGDERSFAIPLARLWEM